VVNPEISERGCRIQCVSPVVVCHKCK